MKKVAFGLVLAVILLSAGFSNAENDETYRRLYAVTAPYLTITDEISFDALSCFWNGSCDSFSPEESSKTLFVPEEELTTIKSIFGSDPDSSHISVIPQALLKIQEYVINNWMIVPFEEIEPRRKVMLIDGEDILYNHFNPDNWPLTGVIGDIPQGSKLSDLPISNRDENKLSNVVLTGVTAMVRAMAAYMDLDPLMPASKIREPLINADILHINNEVPFAEVCDIREHEKGLVFCSRKAYMALLQDIGTDVIELDGDHFQDYGDDAVKLTLDMYEEAGIPYYGGGHNKEEAQQPVILTHNGNSFAFLGCNGKEPGYAAASDTRPGAVHCDIQLLTQQVHELTEQGIIPIVTFQHLEVYQIKPVEIVRKDFEAVRDAGAVIISGSQSHIPMEFDVSENNFVHYGLGNTFFDQAFFLPETAEAFIDRHIFYDGHYINTELLTIRFPNNAFSYFMEDSDRAELLNRVFEVSEVEGLN